MGRILFATRKVPKKVKKQDKKGSSSVVPFLLKIEGELGLGSVFVM